MAESFDPYYKWLGIPAKDQPPNHYRLLGIDLFEPDPDVIDAAANRQMAYIQSCADGPHLALSQQLLNEVSAARVCLLDRRQKAQYDARLRRELSAEPPRAAAQAPPPPPPPPSPAVSEPFPAEPFPIVVDEDTIGYDDTIGPGERIVVDDTPAEPSGTESGEYRLRSPRQSQQVYWIAAAAAGLVVLVLVMVLLSTGGDDPEPERPKQPAYRPRPNLPIKNVDPPSKPEPGILIDDDQVVLPRPDKKQKLRWIRWDSGGATYQGDYYLTDDGRGRGDFVAVFPIPTGLEPGKYEVRVSYIHGAGRATNVQFVVHHANKKSTPPRVNQRERPKIDQQFHKLGDFVFDGRPGEQVIINNKGANGTVVIDAVQLVRRGGPPGPTNGQPTVAPKTTGKSGKEKPAAKNPKKPSGKPKRKGRKS